jgi:hypothetical protein
LFDIIFATADLGRLTQMDADEKDEFATADLGRLTQIRDEFATADLGRLTQMDADKR